MTIGRIFSNTFAGIAPTSAPGFIAAQLIGTALGTGLVLALYPDVARGASNVVVPHEIGDVSSDSPQTAGQRRQP